MDVLNFNEITYKTPSFPAFCCRKEFHMIERESSEDLEHWLQRIQTAIAGCDFGDFTEFMLIEKFLCGLSEENFEKYSKTNTLDVDELLTIGTSNTSTLKSSDDGIEFDPIKDELLSLEIVETNDLHVSNFQERNFKIIRLKVNENSSARIILFDLLLNF